MPDLGGRDNISEPPTQDNIYSIYVVCESVSSVMSCSLPTLTRRTNWKKQFELKSLLVGGFNPYISQIRNLPQVGMKIKNIWNHHPVKSLATTCKCLVLNHGRMWLHWVPVSGSQWGSVTGSSRIFQPFILGGFRVILLMAEILHRLVCMKPYK